LVDNFSILRYYLPARQGTRAKGVLFAFHKKARLISGR
jgi:hypothetical protein